MFQDVWMKRYYKILLIRYKVVYVNKQFLGQLHLFAAEIVTPPCSTSRPRVGRGHLNLRGRLIGYSFKPITLSIYSTVFRGEAEHLVESKSRKGWFWKTNSCCLYDPLSQTNARLTNNPWNTKAWPWAEWTGSSDSLPQAVSPRIPFNTSSALFWKNADTQFSSWLYTLRRALLLRAPNYYQSDLPSFLCCVLSLLLT